MCIYRSDGSILMDITNINDLYKYEYESDILGIIKNVRFDRLLYKEKMKLPYIIPSELNIICIDIDLNTDIDRLIEIPYIKSIHRSISGTGMYCIVEVSCNEYIECYNSLFYELTVNTGLIIDYLPSSVRIITSKNDMIYHNPNNLIYNHETKVDIVDFYELKKIIHSDVLDIYFNDNIISSNYNILLNIPFVYKIYNNKVSIKTVRSTISNYLWARYTLERTLNTKIVSDSCNMNEVFLLYVNYDSDIIDREYSNIPCTFKKFKDSIYNILVSNKGSSIESINAIISNLYNADMSIGIEANDKKNQYTIKLFYHDILVSRLFLKGINPILDYFITI